MVLQEADVNQEQRVQEVREMFAQIGDALDERQRRLWAAGVVSRLGRGGISVVSRAIRMSPNTIRKGIGELMQNDAGESELPEGRIRRKGAGRKRRPS